MNQVLKKPKYYFLLLALMLLNVAVHAQETYTLTGTVKSGDDNQSLPGANVMIKGTTQGTITDFDGSFKIDTKSGDQLLISFLGYATQTVEVTGQKTIEVVLKSDAGMQLSDVVVVGYGVQKRSHLTGSIAKVDDAALAEAPVGRAEEALVGKMSGVQIAATDASAGAAPTINIRGVSSITAGTSPLIVVDGFPIPGDLSSIDMNDVASIEVLKDAASAAIYGSRGANGVIMITTKTGKKGKLSLDVNILTGVKSAYKRDDLYASPSEWIAKMNSAGVSSDYLDELAELGTETDWQDEIFQTANFQKYQVGATGGGEWGNFYIGGSYTSEEGVVITNKYDKFSLRANVNAKLNDRVTVGLQLSGNRYTQRRAAVTMQDALRNQPFLPVTHTAQTLQYMENNGISTDGIAVGDYAHESHFGSLMLTSNNSAITKLLGRDNSYEGVEVFSNAYVSVDLLEGLTFKSTFGTYYDTDQRNYYQSSWGHRSGISAATGTHYNNQRMNMLNENTLNFTKKFGIHDISLLGGFTYQADEKEYIEMTGTNYPNDRIPQMAGAGAVALNNNYIYESTLASVLFRANYTIKDRYLISATARRDGSSRFGADTRWGWFPSLSLGWRVSEEDFMKDIDAISSLKIRATYGTTGNNNFDDYQTIANLLPVTAVLGGVQSGYAAANIANPELGWERTVETNLGFDLGLVDNRFNVSFNYYMTNKDQLLLQVPVPALTGFTEAWQNVGELKTNGFEIDVNTVNYTSDNFTWSTTFNLAHNSNELVNFGGVDQLISTPDPKRPTTWINQVGGPMAQFYGYVMERELTVDEIADPAYPINGTATHVVVKDLNGDGEITDDDRTVLGNPFPDFIWGITNEFKYKDFDFSFMFNGSHGAETANIDGYYFESQWKGGFDSEKFSAKEQEALQVKANTSQVIQDASYISLRNITLGYTAPSAVAGKIGLKGFRVFVSGQNVLYFMADNYTSFNPEAQNWNNENALTPGGQRGGLPMSRTVSLGLNVKF